MLRVAGAAAFTVRDRAWVAVARTPTPSAVCIVKLTVPGVVGVPVMAPVVAFRLTPTGRVPVATVHVYGGMPPVAVKFCE